ncbi:hypothetical protein [Siphonobacter sp. SORGH_AS_0500]|uniref:hypothetical protein n=1 Tax=Siphonobacter sp. SORGH_AS_0500 TaxID=1864824 RepID=UPI002860F837|nr:hypothetical protein [Siphonobacter sp. SORGH_AS_0500]MDR6194775.1 hypothetical protein [Siphonobacter sp. SORGH_AS_0500]
MATATTRLPKVTQSMKKLLDYAEDIRQNHPQIWKKGGNTQGNDSYDTLKEIVNRGHFEEKDRAFVQTWNAWKARHQNHTNIAGMVASLKWLAVPEVGLREMKKVITEEVKKEK